MARARRRLFFFEKNRACAAGTKWRKPLLVYAYIHYIHMYTYVISAAERQRGVTPASKHARRALPFLTFPVGMYTCTYNHTE